MGCQDEKARVGFLSAVLKLNPADIAKTTILNTYLRKEHEDDNQGMLEAEQRGEERGEQRGREEGRIEEKENTAKNMLAMGLPADMVARVTGLSIAQIESLPSTRLVALVQPNRT